MNFIKRHWGIFIVLALSFIIFSRIFHPGFFSVHDDTQPTRVFEMTKSLKDGLFPVRWVSDLGFGYGYPIFNLYAPFPYYVGSLFNIIGFDAITSAKIMFGLAIIAAGVGIYLFIRSFLGELPGVVAAVIYLFYPYFAVNIFVRGAVGEYYAYAILPFIFWGLFRIYYDNSQQRPHHNPLLKGEGKFLNVQIILTSIALVVLIISHNLSAYMLGIILFFFFLSSVWFSKNRKILITQYSIILILAFLLSAFYAIPAFTEMKFTGVGSQVSGNFSYSNHFVCPVQWWDSAWGFGGSVKGCLDGISFRLGKTNIIFAASAIILGFYSIVIKRKRDYTFLFYFSIFLLFFSLFMTSEYSEILWTILPKIEFLQFPWRFLNLTGFAIAVLSGFLVFFIARLKITSQNKLSSRPNEVRGEIPYHSSNLKISGMRFLDSFLARNDKWGRLFLYSTLILIIIATLGFNLKLFTPQNYINRDSSYYTDKSQINFAISKITNEYMPADFIKPVSSDQVPKSPIEIIKGDGKINIVQNKTGTLLAFIQMNTQGEIQINKAYFPAWNLLIDAKEITLKKAPQGMTFSLPSGNHSILLRLTQTPIENFANILTLTGSLALFIGIITFVYVKKTT